jgi:alkanesulfonate monooxygenase SsuD/methylene tetrahydromethanopterin reductase-like flavin-dependent oxidoreductase (luciferase family)
MLTAASASGELSCGRDGEQAMLIGYFTEQPYTAFTNEQALAAYPDDHSARDPGDSVVLFSNRFFDRNEALRLYHERLEEYRLAEEVGFDAIMINEHHGGPYCMQIRCGTMSAVVAAITSKARILMLGTPLPAYDNPVQIAEELAMIDMVSKGRLVAGIVRGGGPEQILNDTNPAYNRERFVEAHDLMIEAWTRPGPFRYEGNHYHVRVVNPWVLPLQQPHPPIFVPGIASVESIDFAARHGYPYVALATAVETTKKIWERYDRVAEESGYTAGPQHHGYLGFVHVAPTEEEALRNAEEYLWLPDQLSPVFKDHWVNPTGYVSWDARLARQKALAGVVSGTVRDHIESGFPIVGTPKQVVAKLREQLEQTRPGSLIMMPNQGRMSHETSKQSIRLMGAEVIPALREIGQELGLDSPFDIDMPVSLRAAAEQQRAAELA